MKEVVYVNEEQLFLTREEAEYSHFVSVLTSRAAAGTDIGNKANVLMSRLDAELSKPDECQISMTAEDKNILSVVFMVYELFRRCKYDVLADHFNVQARLLSKEVIADEAAKIDRFLADRKVDTNELKKKIRHRKKIPVRKLYISDLHFYHDSLNHRMDLRGFSGYEEMNDHMVKQWNDHVTKKDEVYILGDFAISRGRAANDILSRLNGRKYLVEGNHDKFLNDREFDRSLFQWIKPYAEIMDSKRRVILSHYPIFCYKGQYRTTPEGYPLTYMLYGHVHDTHDEKLVNEFIRITRSTVVTSRNKPEGHPIPCNMINCFCMFSDYIPVTLDDWIRIDAGRRAKLNRQSN